jgi:hypothetical protein
LGRCEICQIGFTLQETNGVQSCETINIVSPPTEIESTSSRENSLSFSTNECTLFEYEVGCGVKTSFETEVTTKTCRPCEEAMENCRICLSVNQCLQCMDGF